MFITIITCLCYSSIKPSVFIGEGVRQIVHKIPRFTVNKKGKKIAQYSRHCVCLFLLLFVVFFFLLILIDKYLLLVGGKTNTRAANTDTRRYFSAFPMSKAPKQSMHPQSAYLFVLFLASLHTTYTIEFFFMM